ncbi:MAG: hypothetical protein HY682_02400, partial [Chloroflexi bacterium]|nr:hypothetical protein [Chloroflexota bacterium]
MNAARTVLASVLLVDRSNAGSNARPLASIAQLACFRALDHIRRCVSGSGHKPACTGVGSLTTAFRVGITRDFLKREGSLAFGDIGISLLEGKPSVKWEFLDKDEAELGSDHAGRYDALVVLAPRVTAHTLRARERLALVARFGVGYDTVDVDACTRAGVALTITPDGVRRPVAMSAILFLLALSHRLFAKDRITRSGRWAEKLDYTGTGLTGRT